MSENDGALGGRYEQGRELGAGGMGRVVVAFDRFLGRQLAVKTLLDNANETARLRFIREAQICGGLSHPNIVAVHELGQHEGELYLAMKQVKGEDLKAVLRRLKAGDDAALERYPPRRLLRLFLKVCDAIAYAHDRGVIHRDLKPANIMIGGADDNEVQVMDWGLAKSIGEAEPKPSKEGRFKKRRSKTGATVTHSQVSAASADITEASALVGTLAYMSPEQADNNPELDGRSDVYALGATLFELLTHRPPFSGAKMSMLTQIFKGPKQTPREAAPEQDIAPELEAIVLKAMHIAPRHRYQKASELAADIEAFLDRRPVSAYRENAVEALRRVGARYRKGLTAGGILSFTLIVGFIVAALTTGAAEEKAQRELLQARAQSIETRLIRQEQEALGVLKDVARGAEKLRARSAAFERRCLTGGAIARASEAGSALRVKVRSEADRLRALMDRSSLEPLARLADELDRLDPELPKLAELQARFNEGRARLEERFSRARRSIDDARLAPDRALADLLMARDPGKLLADADQSLSLDGALGQGLPAETRALYRARAFRRVRRSDDARRVLKNLLAGEGDDAEGPRLLARALLAFLDRHRQPPIDNPESRPPDSAAALLDKAIDQAPFLSWLHWLRAEVDVDLGRLDAARDGYERALALRPDDAWCLLSRLDKTMTIYGRARVTRAFADIVQDLAPGLFEAEALGRTLSLWQSNGGRWSVFAKRIKTLGASGDMDRRLAQLMTARGALIRHEVLDGIAAARAALELRPDDRQALGFLGQLLLLREQGLRDLERMGRAGAASAEKKRVELAAKLAELDDRLKQAAVTEERAALAEKKTRLVEKMRKARDALAAVLRRRAPVLKALEAYPKQRDRDLAEAREIAGKAARLYPADPRLLTVRGLVALAEGRAAEARPLLRLGARPSLSLERHLAHARAALAEGGPALAAGVEAARRALQLDNFGQGRYSNDRAWPRPGDPRCHEVLGDLKAAAGELGAAILHYRRGANFALSYAKTRDEALEHNDRLLLKAGAAYEQLRLPPQARNLYDGIARGSGPGAQAARERLAALGR